MCTAEVRGGERFHTKPSVSPSDSFHTSLNTLFTAYLFAPRAPGTPRVLRATDGASVLHRSGNKEAEDRPLAPPVELQTQSCPSVDPHV